MGVQILPEFVLLNWVTRASVYINEVLRTYKSHVHICPILMMAIGLRTSPDKTKRNSGRISTAIPYSPFPIPHFVLPIPHR